MDNDKPNPNPSLDGSAGQDFGDGRPSSEKRAPRKCTAREIELWFVDYLTKLPERTSTEEIDITAPFDNFALDSISALGMTGV